MPVGREVIEVSVDDVGGEEVSQFVGGTCAEELEDGLGAVQARGDLITGNDSKCVHHFLKGKSTTDQFLIWEQAWVGNCSGL